MLDSAKSLQGYELHALDGSAGKVKEFYFDDRHWTIRYLERIEYSPRLDTNKPVSLQYEDTYHGYYGYPAYWSSNYMWGASPYLVPNRDMWKESSENKRAWNPNLRSTRNVTGYHMEASDGPIGHVSDFLIDDQTWAIRYLVIDTHNWWPGKKVLISPRWIDRVSWSDSNVYVKQTRDEIKRSPEYAPQSRFSRDYEIGLFGHYGQSGYWDDEESDRERL